MERKKRQFREGNRYGEWVEICVIYVRMLYYLISQSLMYDFRKHFVIKNELSSIFTKCSIDFCSAYTCIAAQMMRHPVLLGGMILQLGMIKDKGP